MEENDHLFANVLEARRRNWAFCCGSTYYYLQQNASSYTGQWFDYSVIAFS